MHDLNLLRLHSILTQELFLYYEGLQSEQTTWPRETDFSSSAET